MCLSIYFLTACSKNQTNEISAEKQAHLASVDKIVSNEIASFEGSENFDTETIKTLSVLVRTNIEKEILENKFSRNENIEIIDNEIYNIVKQTSGELIKGEDFENLPSFSFEEEIDLNEWQVEIKKSQILELLNKNNIKLSSVSNASIERDENGNATKLSIGGKEFNIDYFKEEFNLPSSKIIDINNNLSHIKITGIGNDKIQNFELTFIKSLSNQGLDYKNIIKSKNNSFKIIKNA